MSGYWAASDLAQYVTRPNLASVIVTATSVPVNLTQFDEIILERSGEFDQAAAKAGYLVPVPSTATAGWSVAKRVVRDGATADLLRIWPSGDPKAADRFQAAYDAALLAIQEGNRPLPGAPPDPSNSGRLLPVYGGNPSALITATMGYPQDLQIPTDF